MAMWWSNGSPPMMRAGARRGEGFHGWRICSANRACSCCERRSAMSFQLYLGFVLATTILILIPGPNVSLIVGNSIAHGTRYGLLTVLGTSSAVVVQLAFTALGLTATLDLLADWFNWIRWLG